MYKLCYHVPPSHLAATKSAVFAAGAGAYGAYDQCAWEVLGTGQFQPRSGSTPFIGEAESLSTIEEYRVEMICLDELISDAVVALKNAHPYEQPAIYVWRLEELSELLAPETS